MQSSGIITLECFTTSVEFALAIKCNLHVFIRRMSGDGGRWVVNGSEDIKLTAPWSRKTQPLSGHSYIYVYVHTYVGGNDCHRLNN